MQNRMKYWACMGALILSSCGDNGIGDEPIPTPGDNPFPKGELIDVVTTLSINEGATRAAGKEFAVGDVLYAYVQAGKIVGTDFKPVTEEEGFNQSDAGKYSRMLSFTMDSNPKHTEDTEDPTHNTYKTSSFIAASKYYWDDFSTTDYDLRDEGRGIRLFYGYCYNGSPASGEADSHITTELNESTGVLGWKVATDQRDTDGGNGMKTSDLLFAKAQKMIRYDHNKEEGSKRGTLKIPYTHAMSKISINIVCREGFDDSSEPLKNTLVTLENVQLKCAVTAPTASIEQSTEDDASGSIRTHEEGEGTNRVFSAIVAPTTLAIGNKLATLENVNGIDYNIYVTQNLLKVAPTGKAAWNTQLEDVETDENLQEGEAHSRPVTRAGDAHIDKGKGYRTKSGVHYQLTVHVDKQQISVLATITDWNDVYAETTGEIHFNNNITETGDIQLGDVTSFDVYRGEDNNNKAFDGNNNAEGINPATTYNYSDGVWSCSPQLYWPNSSTEYYFRALSGDVKSSNATDGNIIVSNTKAGGVNNNDLIWGTTQAHSGTDEDGESYTYAEGEKIKPRTGDVPLIFRHIMSKVVIKLETETTGESPKTLAADGVNLNGAKVQIENIATQGKLDLNSGKITITDADKTGTLFLADNIPAMTYETSTLSAKIGEQIVMPQEFGDNANAKIIIILNDGTTYSAVLKDCKVYKDGVLTNDPITQWESGKRYTYTIHLKKEGMSFRALVEDWKETEGGGNATLEWD